MHRFTTSVSLLMGAALAATACGSSSGAGDDDGNGTVDAAPGGRPDARDRGGGNGDPPPSNASGCRKMDILFVVDDSLSMSQEQANLKAAFKDFARILDEFTITTGEHLDYRVGLTTTDRTVNYYTVDRRGRRDYDVYGGNNGAFHRSNSMTRAWIESADPMRVAQLESIAEVGLNGSGLEMPLDAARLALTTQAKAPGKNVGFMRDDALLATVVLTDEEDCSRNNLRTAADAIRVPTQDNWITNEPVVCERGGLAPAKDFVAFFDTLKGKRERWATAVIAAGEKSCESTGLGKAEASPRLTEFTTLTGKNAVFHSICDGNIAAALEEALAKFQQACLDLPPVD